MGKPVRQRCENCYSEEGKDPISHQCKRCGWKSANEYKVEGVKNGSDRNTRVPRKK